MEMAWAELNGLRPKPGATADAATFVAYARALRHAFGRMLPLAGRVFANA